MAAWNCLALSSYILTFTASLFCNGVINVLIINGTGFHWNNMNRYTKEDFFFFWRTKCRCSKVGGGFIMKVNMVFTAHFILIGFLNCLFFCILENHFASAFMCWITYSFLILCETNHVWYFALIVTRIQIFYDNLLKAFWNIENLSLGIRVSVDLVALFLVILKLRFYYCDETR